MCLPSLLLLASQKREEDYRFVCPSCKAGKRNILLDIVTNELETWNLWDETFCYRVYSRVATQQRDRRRVMIVVPGDQATDSESRCQRLFWHRVVPLLQSRSKVNE